MKSSIVHYYTEIKLYKTLIRSVLICGSENWTFNKTNKIQIDIFEIKILRRNFGPIKGNNQWRVKYDELYKLFDDVCVSKKLN